MPMIEPDHKAQRRFRIERTDIERLRRSWRRNLGGLESRRDLALDHGVGG